MYVYYTLSSSSETEDRCFPIFRVENGGTCKEILCITPPVPMAGKMERGGNIHIHIHTIIPLGQMVQGQSLSETCRRSGGYEHTL